MKVSRQSIINLVTRLKKRPKANLALIGEHYQAMREAQWPAIRWHVEQLSLPTSHLAIDNSEMSIVFKNGSKLRCFSADRLNQMRGLRFTGVLVLQEFTESEMISLIEAWIIPPRYEPPPGIRPMIYPPDHDPDEE